jgi:hypothetical protein
MAHELEMAWWRPERGGALAQRIGGFHRGEVTSGNEYA